MTLSVTAILQSPCPRILRGMLPYGVRTFLQQILRFTSDHLPSARNLPYVDLARNRLGAFNPEMPRDPGQAAPYALPHMPQLNSLRALAVAGVLAHHFIPQKGYGSSTRGWPALADFFFSLS